MATSVSQMTMYRREHPAYYEAEKARNSEYFKKYYETDPAFKNRMLDFSKKYYADPEKRQRKLDMQKLRYAEKKLAKKMESAGK